MFNKWLFFFFVLLAPFNPTANLPAEETAKEDSAFDLTIENDDIDEIAGGPMPEKPHKKSQKQHHHKKHHKQSHQEPPTHVHTQPAPRTFTPVPQPTYEPQQLQQTQPQGLGGYSNSQLEQELTNRRLQEEERIKDLREIERIREKGLQQEAIDRGDMQSESQGMFMGTGIFLVLLLFL